MAKTTPKRKLILDQIVTNLSDVATTTRDINLRSREETPEFPILYVIPGREYFEFGTMGQLESRLEILIFGYVHGEETEKDLFDAIQDLQKDTYQKIYSDYRLNNYAESLTVKDGEYSVFHPYAEFNLTMEAHICRS